MANNHSVNDIWMLLPEVESLGSWRKAAVTRTASRVHSGRPRGTTPADDRYIVLQARRNRRQTEGEIINKGDWTTDIAFYRGQKTARW
ncbi:hypothetical protein TNCV_3587661 [Trichonephila clavipes]|nr:hypothetical protein TNCV_3587661 [Trichonephila clavipes]